MEFKKVKINDLKEAEYNPRVKLKNTDKEFKSIKKSIEKLGYVEPIIVNKDLTIIDNYNCIWWYTRI